jgi:RNA polymerase sigma-70 factor (ECF subfamily)
MTAVQVLSMKHFSAVLTRGPAMGERRREALGDSNIFKDEELVQKTLKGNDSAFEELIRRHKRYVMAIVSHYSRDAQETDDMAQEVFIKAYFSLKTFKFKAPFQHWLSRIASFTAMDHLRKRTRQKEDLFSDLRPECYDWLESVLSAGLNPLSDSRQKKELEDLLETALSVLSAEDQFLMRAAGLEGCSIQELSQRTGWSGALIKVRLFRARKKMRKYLERVLNAEKKKI